MLVLFLLSRGRTSNFLLLMLCRRPYMVRNDSLDVKDTTYNLVINHCVIFKRSSPTRIKVFNTTSMNNKIKVDLLSSIPKLIFDPRSLSSKDKDCQDLQHLKHCIYSIMRLSRSNGSTFDNDAKSCYDRIEMLFPSILAQRLGMSAKDYSLLLSTLEKIISHKTMYGLFDATYQST